MSEQAECPVVLIGGGGHAAVLADILLEQGRQILAIVSPDEVTERQVYSEIKHLSSDDEISEFDPDEVKLVNGIGMMPKSTLRVDLNEYYLSLGYEFESVISSDAIVAPSARILAGAQVFSGAIVQSGAVVGEHCIINTGAVVEHDCRLGNYNHLATRATLCGGVVTKRNVFVGASATVIHGLKIGESCLVAAGVTVFDDLGDNTCAYPEHFEKRFVVRK